MLSKVVAEQEVIELRCRLTEVMQEKEAQAQLLKSHLASTKKVEESMTQLSILTDSSSSSSSVFTHGQHTSNRSSSASSKSSSSSSANQISGSAHSGPRETNSEVTVPNIATHDAASADVSRRADSLLEFESEHEEYGAASFRVLRIYEIICIFYPSSRRQF